MPIEIGARLPGTPLTTPSMRVRTSNSLSELMNPAIENVARLKQLRDSYAEHLKKWRGRWVDVIGPSTSENPAFPPAYGRSKDLSKLFFLAQVVYLGKGKVSGDLESTLADVQTVAEDYLLGDWRNAFHEDELDVEEGWFDELRFGLLASLMRNDLDAAVRVASFTEKSRKFDEGGWDRTKNDNQYYKHLCRSIGNDELDLWEKPIGVRAKKLYSVLEAILGSDNTLYAKRLTQFLNWFEKNEFDDRGNLLISLDGSILHEIARSKQMNARINHDLASYLMVRGKQ